MFLSHNGFSIHTIVRNLLHSVFSLSIWTLKTADTRYIQEAFFILLAQNFSTLAVCIQKVGPAYMIGIAESRNGKCGKGTGIIKPSYSWARLCSWRHPHPLCLSSDLHYRNCNQIPVEGHGSRIADCVQLESDSTSPPIALSKYSCWLRLSHPCPCRRSYTLPAMNIFLSIWVLLFFILFL